MSVQLTQDALAKSKEGLVKPNIVLEIEGLDIFYGAIIIKKFIRIGDPDLYIGDDWVIGGITELENQADLVSFSAGTSNQIRTQLNPDKGFAESITSMQIALIDKDGQISQLISPGVVLEDIMGRRCKVWYGFDETAFKEDYFLLFAGYIDEVGSYPGSVAINIVHPDTLKKSSIFPKANTKINQIGGIDAIVTTITVDSTAKFFAPVLGPDGITFDTSSIKHYIKINDEIIEYTGKTLTTFTGCIRGRLGTVADTHNDKTEVVSMVRLTGNAIDLALKMMFSGMQGPFVENIDVTNFVRISPTETVANAIFFNYYDIGKELGVVIGDYITTTGASNGANNISNKRITTITSTEFGSYIVIDGVSFVEENLSAAVLSIRSQYDVWSDGLRMSTEDVEVSGHLKVKGNFLSNFDYDFVLEDTIDNAKSFIAEQLYNPAAAYSVPRKTKSSVSYHLGPLPTDEIKTLDSSNVINPSSINIKRSTGKNFFNTIIYKYQKDPSDGKYLRGTVAISQTSKDRIPVGNKAQIIESDGLREFSIDNPNVVQNALSLATTASSRKLKKFKFGAEYIQGLKVNLSTGFNLEVDDVVLLDLPDLKITDITLGNRDGESRLFSITNWSLDLKSGLVTLDLIDPNFDKDSRYGLISPTSIIKAGLSNTQFVIQPTYNTDQFGNNEYKKWENYVGTAVRIHNDDFSIADISLINSFSGNTVTLETALSFTPVAGMKMDLAPYGVDTIDGVKLRYVHMQDAATFPSDGKTQYKMI
jgi:hypothetical protein